MIKITDCLCRDKYLGTVALRPHQLSALESIQEVTDFVQIQANQPHFRNLNFLKNLRIIHGRKLDRLRLVNETLQRNHFFSILGDMIGIIVFAMHATHKHSLF